MSTMIQIRNVPSELHRQIKARAALAGMSMSQFILVELSKVLERPTREELLERITALPALDLEPTPDAVIREERDRH